MKLTLLSLALISAATLYAQPSAGGPPDGGQGGPPNGPGPIGPGPKGPGPDGPGPRGPRFRPMVTPLMVALDANKDGELSAEEIANAVTALKALDKDGDGKVSQEELRPVPPVRPDAGNPGEGGRGQGGRGEGRPPRGPRGDQSRKDGAMNEVPGPPDQARAGRGGFRGEQSGGRPQMARIAGLQRKLMAARAKLRSEIREEIREEIRNRVRDEFRSHGPDGATVPEGRHDFRNPRPGAPADGQRGRFRGMRGDAAPVPPQSGAIEPAAESSSSVARTPGTADTAPGAASAQ